MITKVPFREICESSVGLDNKSFVIKSVRLLIRYSVRIVGYSFTVKILGWILRAPRQKVNSRKEIYFWYLLGINKLRIEYLSCLSKYDLQSAVRKKNEWAELAMRDSGSRVSRWTAKSYLSLMSMHGFYDKNYFIENLNNGRVSDKKFFIYGPNAKTTPSHIYKDHVLVLMKPIDFDATLYKENILFINSIYYRNVVCKNEDLKNHLINKYDSIFVSCRESVLSEPFQRSKFPIGDQLASPMALGRVLYNLRMMYGTFSCVIDGFDFYLDSAMYGSYYPTLTRNKNNMISEQVICASLADHDSLFNFLYVKEMVKKIDVIDSIDFKQIIELSGEEYLNELAKVRDFESLL